MGCQVSSFLREDACRPGSLWVSLVFAVFVIFSSRFRYHYRGTKTQCSIRLVSSGLSRICSSWCSISAGISLGDGLLQWVAFLWSAHKYLVWSSDFRWSLTLCLQAVVWYSLAGGTFLWYNQVPFIAANPRTGAPMFLLPGKAELGVEGVGMASARLSRTVPRDRLTDGTFL